MQVFFLILGLIILYLAVTNKLYYMVQILIADASKLNTPVKQGAR